MAVFPLTSLCLSCSTCKMGIMEILSSWCYFEHITNCSCVGVLPIVQMDLAMNGENLKEDKRKKKKQTRFYSWDKNTQPKTDSYPKNFTVVLSQ